MTYTCKYGENVVSLLYSNASREARKTDNRNIKELPVGFLDSGLGGLSVLKEAVKLMPAESFIYYGDSANAPYGTKDTETIRALTFAAVEKLLKMGIKGLAVACNTATGAAVKELRAAYPHMPIVGIEPAVKPASEMSRGGTVLVLATPMTIKQDKFRALLARYSDNTHIVPVECAGLMEFVENGDLDSDVLDAYFNEHLLPYLANDTETIVLGCTHYPFLRPHLREFLGDRNINIIDGSRGTSAELHRRLSDAGLLKERGEGSITVLNSSGEREMIERSYRLLSLPID